MGTFAQLVKFRQKNSTCIVPFKVKFDDELIAIKAPAI